jgi:hypothetical protein
MLRLELNHPPRLKRVSSDFRYFHSGDLGDVIAFLPVVRQLGGGHIVLGLNPDVRTRETMTEERFQNIASLIECQPYINSVSYGHYQDRYHIDFSRFRDKRIRPGESLAVWQARYAGVQRLDLSPWLKVPENPKFEAFKGRPVFARSPRYQNRTFPWGRVVKRWPNAVFVGTRGEHELFSRQHRVAHAQTDDLMEVAQVIAGCSVFVGNQSCPCWIAMGLGVPVIQETWHAEPNSMVKRPNSQFIINGIRLKI